MSESNVLMEIIKGVLEDVQKQFIPISQLKRELGNAPELRGAFNNLNQDGIRLIAEVKRASPSKGNLAEIADPKELAWKYQEGGADVISVLTEERRFKGSTDDLISVRSHVDLPVLRKDFIVTEFQVFESRILGADLILLIVAGLSKNPID
jgi:indole-3-glycerol phosphate synthase